MVSTEVLRGCEENPDWKPSSRHTASRFSCVSSVTIAVTSHIVSKGSSSLLLSAQLVLLTAGREKFVTAASANILWSV